ncbi:MAG: 3-hydroxyacyl-CoA dehydrogenase NAD-binding domain-containing protein, partial [Candidatus Omnitrophota bacterium]|nr:3-hydroxyacyl-CoA dehydrogenase NAD-binding domain-containing protein [Candidatus Omnitrophota bacterium]
KAGQDLFNKIEDLNVPTIAVIDGVALGGGCELVLACQYRLATFNDKVRIGLPEVNLGVVPGFGGTYRLPRIVGLSEGLKMILAGKPVDGQKALRLGLVDQLIFQKGMGQQIQEFVSLIDKGGTVADKYKRKKQKGMPAFLDNTLVGNKMVFSQSRKSVLQLTKGFYPARLKAIDVISKNFYMARTPGLAIESRAFGELAVTDISKNLVKLFYLSEKYKKLSLPGIETIKPQKMERCAVLGAGIMGGGIAQLLAANDIWVRMKDINYDALAKGYKAAYKIFSQEVQKRRYTKAQADVKMAHISAGLDYAGFRRMDMVIEAVVEKMEVKKNVFKELSEMVGPNTILATNTSALSVTEMAKVTKDPTKVIGLHFFNPVHRMPLVEIITTPMTSKETISATLNLAKRAGKTPILVRDSCGFVVNRILLGYINEAGKIYQECGNIEGIDQVMTDFGMPMGPFTLSDEVGLDVGIKVLHILKNSFGERFKAADIFEKVFAKGLLGKKTEKGFYLHAGKKRVLNPEIAQLSGVKNTKPLNRQECEDRLIYVMVNEAARCLEDKIIDEADAIDVGMIFGTGFPPFRGGLLRYADNVGLKHVVQRIEEFSERFNSSGFKPCPYLQTLSQQNKGFYS